MSEDQRARRMCLDCRTLLGDDAHCDGGSKHRVVDVSSPTGLGLSAVIDEVWGPPSVRLRARQLAKAGGTGASVGGAFDGCGSCGDVSVGGDVGEILGAILLILVAAVVAVLLFWLLAKLVRAIRIAMSTPKPRGAVLPPPNGLGRRGVAGVVVSGESLESPVSLATGVAYALEYRQYGWVGHGVTLREGQTAGFTVELTDGRRVRIPPGRVRLEGSFASVLADGHARAYADKLFPASVDSEFPAVPYNDARELMLGENDSVEIVSELALAPDEHATGATGGSYRAAAMVLVPVGVPLLRVTARGNASSGGVRVAPGNALAQGHEQGHELGREIEAESSRLGD